MGNFCCSPIDPMVTSRSRCHNVELSSAGTQPFSGAVEHTSSKDTNRPKQTTATTSTTKTTTTISLSTSTTSTTSTSTTTTTTTTKKKQKSLSIFELKTLCPVFMLFMGWSPLHQNLPGNGVASRSATSGEARGGCTCAFFCWAAHDRFQYHQNGIDEKPSKSWFFGDFQSL